MSLYISSIYSKSSINFYIHSKRPCTHSKQPCSESTCKNFTQHIARIHTHHAIIDKKKHFPSPSIPLKSFPQPHATSSPRRSLCRFLTHNHPHTVCLLCTACGSCYSGFPSQRHTQENTQALSLTRKKTQEAT